MQKKTSAHYQREYRKRLRENGLVKKEVWIRPENALKLSSLEHTLRKIDLGIETDVINTGKEIQWTTLNLFKEFQTTELFTSKRASLELIEGIDPAIHITMHEYGDLPIFLAVLGKQIIAESLLWSIDNVINKDEFNQIVLQTHKYFPLSTISMDKLADGVDYYHMFGALSSTSILINIIFEIEMLASNVIKATEAYSEYLVY